jgi:hypothetical protein
MAVAPADAGDTAPCSNRLVGESFVSATDPGGDTGFAGITATLCCAAPSRTPAAVENRAGVHRAPRAGGQTPPRSTVFFP